MTEQVPSPPEYVVLPRDALLKFLGAEALPPWFTDDGEMVGANIDCAPIAARIVEWITKNDLSGVVS